MSPTDPAQPRSPHAARDDGDLLRRQVQQLQEALGFADHRTDQLSQEVRELNQRLELMQRRVAKLEGRVENLAAGPESTEDQTSPEAPTQD